MAQFRCSILFFPAAVPMTQVAGRLCSCVVLDSDTHRALAVEPPGEEPPTDSINPGIPRAEAFWQRLKQPLCSVPSHEMMPPRCSLSQRAAPFTLLLLQAAPPPSLPPPCAGGDGWSTLRAAPGLDVLSNVPVFMSSERPLESSEPHKWKLFTITLISLMWKVFKVKSYSLQLFLKLSKALHNRF